MLGLLARAPSSNRAPGCRPAPVVEGSSPHVCSVATSSQKYSFLNGSPTFKRNCCLPSFERGQKSMVWDIKQETQSAFCSFELSRRAGPGTITLEDRRKVFNVKMENRNPISGVLNTSVVWYTTWRRAALLPGSNDSKQICLTVCLGSPGLKFYLLHSNCFLNFLLASPPSVPPSLKGVPGCAWLRQAGLRLTGCSDPAGAILVSICKTPLVLPGCFSHHRCQLGRGPA